MTIVAVIQARTGSKRLPGKIMEPVAGLPLAFWTISAVEAVPGVDHVVVATTDEPEDDRFVAALAARGGPAVHRGSVHDVLGRIWDAVSPLGADIVLRQTGDNPFADPSIMAAQLARLDEGFDYVGIAGLPLGIGAEVVRYETLRTAMDEATTPAEREHVLPFVYHHPQRFRIGFLDPPPHWRHQRYTVDTAADLAFARALAARLPDGPPTRLATLEAIVAIDPSLAEINAAVSQRDARDAELAPLARSQER